MYKPLILSPGLDYIPLEEQDTYDIAKQAINKIVTLVNLSSDKHFTIHDRVIAVHGISKPEEAPSYSKAVYFVASFGGSMPLPSSIWKLVPEIDLAEEGETDG